MAARQRDRLVAARPDRRRRCQESPDLAEFAGRVSDSGEGRWTSIAAIEEGVPAQVLTVGALRAVRLARPGRLRRQGAVGDAQAVRRPRREAGLVTETLNWPLRSHRAAAPGRRWPATTRRSGTPTCATCSPTTPSAASASTAEGAGTSTSTTPSTASPTRRCALLRRAGRGVRAARSASTRCSAARRSTSPRTAPCCTSRCARRATRRIVVDGEDVVAGGARGARPHGRLRRPGALAASGRGTPASRIRNVVNIGIGGSDLGPGDGLRGAARTTATAT